MVVLTYEIIVVLNKLDLSVFICWVRSTYLSPLSTLGSGSTRTLYQPTSSLLWHNIGNYVKSHLQISFSASLSFSFPPQIQIVIDTGSRLISLKTKSAHVTPLMTVTLHEHLCLYRKVNMCAPIPCPYQAQVTLSMLPVDCSRASHPSESIQNLPFFLISWLAFPLSTQISPSPVKLSNIRPWIIVTSSPTQFFFTLVTIWLKMYLLFNVCFHLQQLILLIQMKGFSVSLHCCTFHGNYNT